MNIALIGNGRMGRMIDTVCAQDEALNVVGFVGPGACDSLSQIENADVAIDIDVEKFWDIIEQGIRNYD